MQLIKNNFDRAVLTVMACLNFACAPIKVLNSIIPENGYQLHAAIPYGTLARQKLDIYQPTATATEPRKVVIFYYGGSWDSGERGDYKFVAEALTSQGYIVVIPDYRVYPDVLFPELMVDPASAAKWVKQHIAEYGGSLNEIFLMGHSAGAHIALMLSVNAEYLVKQAIKPNDFAGVIGLAGPYDFLPLKSERLKIIFGPEAERWKSQPINFVDGKNPPMLLALGKKDDTVWRHNTINMAKKIKEHQGLVEVVEFEQYGHIDMVAKLAKPLRGSGDLLNVVVDFLQKN